MATCKNPDCGKKFKPEFPFQKGCCRDCMVVIGMAAVRKKREKEAAQVKKQKIEQEREKRRALKARKEALKPRSNHVKQAQQWFNRFIISKLPVRQ